MTDALGNTSPGFANADYFFEQENIIAELKCLTEDKLSDSRQSESIRNLFEQNISLGQIPDPGPGIVRINSSDCPLDIQRKLYSIISRPIKTHIEKANRQIRETRRQLNRPDAHGLLLFANDGNFRLELDQFAHAIDVTLGNSFRRSTAY